MNKFYTNPTKNFLLVFLLLFAFGSNLNAQINFNESTLDLNGNGSLGGVTSLMYGPDGKLYIAEYTGAIKVLTVQRNTATNYVVTNLEVLDGIQTMQDHDDDGALNSEVTRQTTGLTVAGTASNPIIYVTSSDIRIGAGDPNSAQGSNGDVNLDTNSGVITRFSWNGTSWDVVDLVRGLPRSEENHATNGLELTTINGVDYLLVASGGFTNGGSPSTNFVYACEYALSGAILSVDLDAINALPISNDNGRSYIYDLPTLDDPTRANVNGITDPDNPSYNGIDVNDPFGGNDGLNQAVVEPGGPVQIFSPGYRNSYDLVVTESGALYVTDNGPNTGWGGFPLNEGTANVTNNYDPNESGSQSPSGGEIINNEDHLELVTTNVQTYNAGSFYGGHPNPTRANPDGAGLYTAPSTGPTNAGAVFRTLIYDPDGSRGVGYTTDASIALPADWPPVAIANPVEGDYRGPGITNPDGPDDNEITIWATNTNGLDEYTASNFGGQMQGNLIAGSNNSGNIRRVQLDASGQLQALTQNFISPGGGNTLGITCNSDTDIFPGTIWSGSFSFTNGTITVFEPADAVVCINPGEVGYDPNADYDSDGYTNQDEEDNNTDPCNGGSQPADFDKALGLPFISDLNDTDDDGDGILDADDAFQLGDINSGGSDAFTIPISNDLTSGQQGLGGIFDLGMTGLMNDGSSGPNWLDWIDRIDNPNDPNPNDVLGGAPAIMTSHMTSGTALAGTNTQEKGYQFGVQTSSSIGKFTVSGNLINLVGPLRIYGNNAAIGGELGHFIGDGTQSNYIKVVLTTSGITALQEINDIPQAPINVSIPLANRPTSNVVFYFVVDPSNGEVVIQYTLDGGARSTVGTIIAQGSILDAIQQANQDLAVGFIGTSGTTGVELEGTWDFLSVFGEVPVVTEEIPDLVRFVNSPNEDINLNEFFADDNGLGNLTYTVFSNSNPAVGTSIGGNNLTLSYPSTPNLSTITIRATDIDGLFVDETFQVNVTDAPIVLYRVNAGGPEITAIDGGLNWEEDTASNNSAFLISSGTNQTFSSTNLPADGSVNQATTPLSVYATERYDASPGNPNMTYSFPVNQSGNYEIRLYMGNSFVGTSQAGQRIFDATIEGIVPPLLDNIDLSGTYGHETGTVISHTINVTDGVIDISFPHVGPENPIINAIEILDAPDNETPIYVYPVANQFNSPSDVLNGSLGVNAFGGDGNLQYAATGLPPGVNLEPTNGQIGGTIGAGAAAGSPYNVTITINDMDGSTSDIVTTTFVWTVGSNVWVDKNENENYTARHECSFVQAGDKFYLMGGRENAQTVDVYDYASNTWVNLTASAPKEFNHFQATEYQGLIWVIGAFGDNGFPNEVPEEFIWAFDPSNNEWIQGPQIPAARRRGSTGLVVQNNKFYIVGGNTDGHAGGYVPWFDEYDPATGVWTALADSPRARDHFSAAVIGNNLYVAGGRLSGGAGGVFAPTIAEVDVYDFGAGTWSTLPAAQNIPTPRGGSSSVNFNDKLVVIGGEVQNQDVYGVNTSDALKITEEYDPATQTWTRLSDLNSERHGTQAIVSGNGIFTLAGSPTLGGGSPPNQKNMEYLGIDNPVGAPSTTSSLSAPASVLVADGTTQDIEVAVVNGNVGVLVTSMEITGTNAADFTIATGELTNQLLNANATHTVSVALSGAVPNRNAVLTLNYGNGESITIDLTNFDSSLNVTNPGTQNNNEGDVVSLQIQAVGASSYSATGLPPTLSINATTGLISGTVSEAGVNDGPFLEQGGLVVIEAESGVVVPTWSQTTAGGATGIIAGTDHLSIQNGGTIPYQITISTPGVYRFNWRSFFSGAVNTEENDNWLKFPNEDGVWFFGYQGNPIDEASLIANVTSANPTEIVFPKGSPRITGTTTPEGNGTNGYFKIFRSGGASEVYDWQALTSDNDSHDIYVYFENAGTFTMEVSERSAGHAIDKMALYKVDNPTPSNTQLTNAPESSRASGGGAADGSPYTVTVTVADNGTQQSNANTQFIWNIGEAGDPIAIAMADITSGFAPLDVSFTGSTSTDDVGVVTYLWDFGDGTPTSNLSDPAHTFTAVGTYNVQLTVEDGDGNTNMTSLTITVTDPASAGTIRINSGGPTYTFDGVDWNVDQHFIGGTPFERVVDIANTANNQLYQTERFSDTGTLTYEIPVVSGNYNVNLHFAELFYGLPGLGEAGGAGSRVFDINVENGQVQLNDYDIFIAAGGAGTAIIEDFSDIDVSDGNLTITLTGSIENPKISGIEVIIPGGNSVPVVYAGENQIITLPSTSLEGSATDADGGGISSYVWTQQSGPGTATISTANDDDTVVSGLEQGTYVFRLTATDEEGDTGFDEVTITIDGVPGSLLINSGGPDVTFGTEEWTADQHFVGGAPFENVVAIANTMNDEIYQTERFDSSGTLVYEIPLAQAANYNVDLHFAELFFGQPGLGSAGGAGSRVFNINIENGQVQVDNYDIFAAAGGSATAVIETYKAISVTDGSLTVTLTGVVENPKISGIGVYDTAPPVADAGEDQTVNLPTNTITLLGSGTDPDGGAIVTYQWTQESGQTIATLNGDETTGLIASDLEVGDYVFRLTVTDDEDETSFDEVTVTVVAPDNEAPIAVAEATPLNGNAPLAVNFTGSNSTDDVAVTTYAWDFMDGNTSAEADPMNTFTVIGTYEVELTVTDAEGVSNTDTVTIVVTDPTGNQAPTAVAEATPLTGVSPLNVIFTGSNSTDDVAVTTYAWDFMDGNTSSEADPMNTFTVAGTYVVELTVTDAEGLSNTDTVTIVVTDAGGNQAPTAVAEATPLTGISPLNVIFTGSNSRDDVAVTTYAWDFMDGNTSSEADPVHTFTVDGTYNVELTVSDAEGLTNTAMITIVVGDGMNQAPTALISADPTEGEAPFVVQFDGSESIDDVGVVSYSWDFGDGTDISTEAAPEHIYTIAGVYTVTLTVEDAEGLSSMASIDITVTEGVKLDIILESNPPNAEDGVARVLVINKPEDMQVLFVTIHDVGGRYINGYLPDRIVAEPNTYEIPISNLRNGLYLIRVTMSEGDSTLIKLMISN